MFITAEECSWLHGNITFNRQHFSQVTIVTDYVETGPNSHEHIFKEAVESRISSLKLSRNSILKKLTIRYVF